MAIISLLSIEEKTIQQPRSTEKLLRHLLLPYGGGEFFFAPEEKPFFLLDLKLPADNELGVNFDVRLAYAIAVLAKDCGVEEVVFGVRCEEGFDFRHVITASGYANLEQLGYVHFVDLNGAEVAARSTDTSLLLNSVDLCKSVLQADIIVSLSKLKVAEGQLFGSALNAVSAVAAPLDQSKYDYEQRQRALVDLYSAVSPDLTIVDGIRGNGNFQTHCGDFVLAATDAVAADAVLSAISGIDMASFSALQLAAQYGLGVGEPADIRLYGDDISDLMA